MGFGEEANMSGATGRSGGGGGNNVRIDAKEQSGRHLPDDGYIGGIYAPGLRQRKERALGCTSNDARARGS